MFEPTPTWEQELREGFCLLDPPESRRAEAVVVAWRLAREAAHQRGLFSAPSDRLADLARLSPDPWTTAFGYEREPQVQAVREMLDAEPLPLLPAPTAPPAYLEALAAPIQLYSTPSGRIGANFFALLHIQPQEILDCEERIISQFLRDMSGEGISEAQVRVRLLHGLSQREVIQLAAMATRMQAESLAGVSDEALIRAQIIAMDRLAARMSSGIEPDLRGAMMARREIARLLKGESSLGMGAGGTLPAAPLARIIEEEGDKLPPRKIPMRPDE